VDAGAEQRIILAIKEWRKDLVANTESNKALIAELRKHGIAQAKQTKLVCAALDAHGERLDEVAELLEDTLADEEDEDGEDDDEEDDG